MKNWIDFTPDRIGYVRCNSCGKLIHSQRVARGSHAAWHLKQILPVPVLAEQVSMPNSTSESGVDTGEARESIGTMPLNPADFRGGQTNLSGNEHPDMSSGGHVDGDTRSQAPLARST